MYLHNFLFIVFFFPQCEKPNRAEHDKSLSEVDAKFEKLRNEKRKVQEKIEDTKNEGKGSEISKARDAMNALKKKKLAMINEKKLIRAELDNLKAVGDKLAKGRKDTR